MTTVSRTSYHGWKDALLLSNGKVEAIIVPAIGRVMQFRFIGKPGPFWENRALDGKPVNPDSQEWGNFGGDKSWPAPQADWPKITSRGWPPPKAFDSMPVDASVEKDGVVLVSAIDPHYGIRTYRRITLDSRKPVLKIKTIYEKVSGDPQKVGIWVITQLNHPEAVLTPVATNSAFAEGYNKQSEDMPEGFKKENGFLSMIRGSKKATKIGMDSEDLIWVGKDQGLWIKIKRGAGEYPDNGSSTEIYTSADPLPYVELETLGPLHELKVGSKIEETNVYTLFERTKSSPLEEAKAILAASSK